MSCFSWVWNLDPDQGDVEGLFDPLLSLGGPGGETPPKEKLKGKQDVSKVFSATKMGKILKQTSSINCVGFSDGLNRCSI